MKLTMWPVTGTTILDVSGHKRLRIVTDELAPCPRGTR